MGASVEIAYTDALDWYWDLIHLSSSALATYDFEAYQYYEDWRRDIKGAMLG